MTQIKLNQVQYQEFEHQEGYLVAVEKELSKSIGAFFKANKGKKKLPSDKIKGYKFIMDQEFNSLKIDFETEFEFEIKNLTRIKLT